MSRSQPININKNILETYDDLELLDDLSCSIIIDHKKDFGTTPPEKDYIQTKLNTIYPKSNGKWIDSKIILKCQLCSVSFGFFIRKHHCRACGRVFCDTCCHKKIKIPENFITRPKEDTTFSQTISNTMKWFISGNDDLVCQECYNKIDRLNKITNLIRICEYLDFESLNTILFLSNNWYNAGIHQLSKFREIQYLDPHALFTNWQKNIVWLSRELFIGHNIIMIIKSGLQLFYEKEDSKILKEIFILISKKNKVISCRKAMCSRKCNIGYDFLDFLELLKFVSILEQKKRLLWYSKELQNLVSVILKHINSIEYQSNSRNELTDKIKYVTPLLCSIFSLICNVKEERINFNFMIKIFDTIFDHPVKVENLTLELKYLETVPHNSIGIINFIKFMKSYIHQKSIDIQKNIQSMIMFFEYMCKNYSNLEILLSDPISYPLDLSYKITKIIKIEVLKSNTSPLLVFATITKNDISREVKFIIKKDTQLRKECIVACLIKLLQDRLYHQALRKRVKMFDKIPTYQIIVLTSEMGIIEFVEESLTLRMVGNKGLTLQNYILDNNLKELVDNTKRRFMQSLAISCCISYILGLGDRHLDNIMINKKGQLFHIDYGYLMDNPITSLLTAPVIKITPVMIDFLGGTEGLYYKEFTEYIIQIYDLMRLYKNLIINYYEMLGNEKFVDWIIFKEKLESRFLYGLNWKDVQVTLINEIETSNSNLSAFGDFCHNTRQSISEIFSGFTPPTRRT